MAIFAWIFFGARIRSDGFGEETLQKMLHNLFLNGFYLDRFYQTRISESFRATAGFLWRKIDAGWVDAGLDQSARTFLLLAERLRLWTTGRVSQYVSMMVAGLTLILCGLTVAWWYLLI
jgi:NADH:ubiquinone oxidoreductase subunit 5 (subunit L)/multisubunit Na+/H+ antiporter MnhA subunit